MTLSAAILDRVDPARLAPLFEGQAEDVAYLEACAQALSAQRDAPFRLGWIVVSDESAARAAAPVFHVVHKLDAALQGRARALADGARRIWPNLARLSVACMGSPYSDRAPLGLARCAGPTERKALWMTLLEGLGEFARREGAGLAAVKDLDCDACPDAAGALAKAGFARVGGLPSAVLPVVGGVEGWLAGLSPATRKDLRRKLRSAGAAAVTIERRSGAIGDLDADLSALYEATRAGSAVDYDDWETLPPGWFAAIGAALGERAIFQLYRVEGRLVAFNLLLVGADRLIDKFLGMSRADARAHDLYALSWRENLRLADELGKPLLQTGQTAYALKMRYGSRLEPLDLWFRHSNRVADVALRLAAPWLAFDRHDPDLRALAARHGGWAPARTPCEKAP